MDEKADFDRMEKGPQRLSHRHNDARRESARHGDRALSLIGDERVTLTEEDVRAILRGRHSIVLSEANTLAE